MTARSRAAVFVLAWMVPAMLALGQGVKDPLSGQWGMEGLTYLDLKFDGRSSVTGITVWRHASDHLERAAINTGSFDRDSGALRLTGEAKNQDGDVVPYVIDGRLDGDVLAGTFAIGGQKGDFRFTRL